MNRRAFLRRLVFQSGRLVFLSVLIFAAAVRAQISAGGTPVSFSQNVGGEVPTLTMPLVDVASYLAEDARAPKDAPYRFGAPHEVHLTLDNSGGWTDLPDGGHVWRLRIVSHGAFSINILYDRFSLPDGATLFLYDHDHGQVIGAFTSANNWMDGTFCTQPVAGDAITLEYYEPASVRGQGVISIFRVVHAYRNVFGRARTLDDYGDSGTCNNNVNCPEGASWQSQKRGVALIVDGGFRICTGSLINNTANNFRPFFLTANHCLGGETQWLFVFNYESPGCANQDGPTSQTVANAVRRANNSASDFALLELSSAVPLSYNPYLCGWSRVDSPATSSVCIHHPEGDIKKISFDYEPPAHGGWTGTPANSHWHILAWDDGTTEPGSSGAPLFDQNRRITGQLHGGEANCSNNVNDYFGKFSLSWNYGTTPATRLRDWLDSANTGVLTLEGIDPNMSGRAAGTVTDEMAVYVPGVRVGVLEGPNETTTDNRGRYMLPLPSGTYTLDFTKFGYQHVLVTNVQVTENDTTTVNVTMTSLAMGVLVGRVQSQTDFALPGAFVRILDTPLDTLITDAGGEFTASLPATSYPAHLWYAIHLTPPVTVSLDTTVALSAGDTTRVTLTLTLPRTEPTAADQYGYQAYDRYDAGEAATYEWVELDPALGGQGTEFFYGAQDSSAYLGVPFPLKFYGTTQDSLTVSENGWMLPGVHQVAGAINTPIPSDASSDPAGIIAPLWDDLRDGLGNRQFAWYDTLGGRWILQFTDQRLVSPANRLHSWQVHVLDPVFHPTLYGDCQFLFVYGRTDLPSFCTVGLENPGESTGLQVLYNGLLDSHSWPIENGAALRFTTGRGSGVGSVTVNLSLYPPPADLDDVTVYLAGRVITANGSGIFVQDSIPAVSACGLVSLAGYERTRACGFAIIANTMNQAALAAWRLDPPAQLTATQFDGAVTLRWRRPQSVAYHANPDVRYAVYRDGELAAAELADTIFTDEPLPDSQLVHYQVMARYEFGDSPLSETLPVEIDLNADGSPPSLPATYALHLCFPNPFNPATTIRFDMPRSGRARMRVVNLSGQIAATLVDAEYPAGAHAVTWNAQAFPSGTYLAVFEAGGQRFVQKLLLLK